MPGATKSVYAPDPFDVSRILQAEIIVDGQKIALTTTGPVDPGLVSWIPNSIEKNLNYVDSVLYISIFKNLN